MAVPRFPRKCATRAKNPHIDAGKSWIGGELFRYCTTPAVARFPVCSRLGDLKLDVGNRRGWLRDYLAVLDHAFEMKLNRLTHVVLDFLNGVAGGDALVSG